jgi:hypothetical protein
LLDRWSQLQYSIRHLTDAAKKWLATLETIRGQLMERKNTRKESVAVTSSGNFRMFARRSTWLSIFVSGCAFCWTAAGAQAGVILPCAVEESATNVEVALDSAVTAGTTQQPVVDRKDDGQRDHALTSIKALEGLLETGGASAPTSGPVGQSGAVPAALLDIPDAVPETRSFAYLREEVLQLPQPPPGELLDPPKCR